jgi:Carboxypeptidase regulatory-like domain
MSILLSVLLMFQQPAPRPSIEGQVMRADSPEGRPVAIPEARVELTGGTAAPKIVRTGSDGRFRIADIEPGQYRLKVAADGFAAAEYGQAAPNVPGTQLTIRTGTPVPRMDFKLVRAATITGRVHDFDNEPLGNVIVQLFRAVAGAPGPAGPRTTAVAFTRTNDRGEYRFYWITPDEYYVSVNYTSARLGPVFVPPNANAVPAPNGYPQVYYREAPDLARAEKLQIKAGEERSAVDFHLVRVPMVNISGTVTDSGTGRGIQVEIQLVGRTSARTRSDLAGKYELRNVPSGSYRIAALSVTAEGLFAERQVEVGDRDLTGVDIVMDPGFSIHGRITTDDGSPLPDLGRSTIRLAGDARGGQAQIQADGLFEIEHVTKGSYSITASNLPEDFYVKSATLGRDDALKARVSIFGDMRDPLEVVLSSATGRIRGTVTGANGTFFPGAQIVLVPDEGLRSDASLFKTATADQSGAFTLRGIPPGNYVLFAWNFLEPRAYADQAFLRRYEQEAVPIKIESRSESTVRVPVIMRER